MYYHYSSSFNYCNVFGLILKYAVQEACAYGRIPTGFSDSELYITYYYAHHALQHCVDTRYAALRR